MRVFVIGLGLTTSLGRGVATNWDAVVNGKSGISKITRFDPTELPVKIAATVDSDVNISPGQRCRNILSGVVSEATRDLPLAESDWSEAEIFLSAPTPDSYWKWVAECRPTCSPKALYYDDMSSLKYAQTLDPLVRSKRPAVMLNTACASGATAIEMAFQSIFDGCTELALVAGSDACVYEESIAKFCLLSALSNYAGNPSEACRPFSEDRSGFVMGEGGAAMVLVSERMLDRLSVVPQAQILGAGNATDSFHRTRTSPDGIPIIQSMQRALDNSGIGVTDVSYINAHGTGTPENDKMESLGIRSVFGDAAQVVPVTSNKSMIGHTLTAAGLVEGVLSVVSIKEGNIPPTINFLNPDLSLGVQVVGNQSRRTAIDIVLSNSFGFGGQNVSVVFADANYHAQH